VVDREALLADLEGVLEELEGGEPGPGYVELKTLSRLETAANRQLRQSGECIDVNRSPLRFLPDEKRKEVAHERLLESINKEYVRELQDCLNSLVTFRRLFRTQKGFLGIGYGSVEMCDEVCSSREATCP